MKAKEVSGMHAYIHALFGGRVHSDVFGSFLGGYAYIAYMPSKVYVSELPPMANMCKIIGQL